MTHLNPIVIHRLEAFIAPPTIAPPPSRMIKNNQRCDYVMTLHSDYFTEVASLLALRLKGEAALTRMEQSVYKEISYTTNHKRIWIRQTRFMGLKSSWMSCSAHAVPVVALTLPSSKQRRSHPKMKLSFVDSRNQSVFPHLLLRSSRRYGPAAASSSSSSPVAT